MVGVRVELGEMSGEGVAVAVSVIIVENDCVVVAAAQTATTTAREHENSVRECMFCQTKTGYSDTRDRQINIDRGGRGFLRARVWRGEVDEGGKKREREVCWTCRKVMLVV